MTTDEKKPWGEMGRREWALYYLEEHLLPSAKDHDLVKEETCYKEVLKEIAQLKAELAEIREKVDSQAEDEGLWFVPEYASEDYLQRGLRELHSVIEKWRKT